MSRQHRLNASTAYAKDAVATAVYGAIQAAFHNRAEIVDAADMQAREAFARAQFEEIRGRARPTAARAASPLVATATISSPS